MTERRPLIGLTCDFDLKQNAREVACLYPPYYEAIERAGGLPVLVPPLMDDASIAALLERLDGVVLTGGDDYDPARFGEALHHTYTPVLPQRESADFRLVEALLRTDLPVLGICGGMQLLNLALGGTLIQDLPSERPDADAHSANAPARCSREVTAEPGTTLNPDATEATFTVVCSHHQAVAEPGAGLRVVARAHDGTIEALERSGLGYVLGVQWHPELSLPDGPGADEQRALFARFVAAARAARAMEGAARPRHA